MTKKEKILIPLGNRILLRPEQETKAEKKTAGGIILPEQTAAAKERERTMGRVVRVSPELGKKNIAEGDVVVYSKFGFDKIVVGGEELIMVEYDNVLAVFK